MILSGVYFVSNRLFFLKTIYPEKVWIHRVNSIEKLKEVENEFSGIELDLVWEGNNFDVNHPPATSIGLNLDEYFKQINSKNLKIWIDFKNLDSNNVLNSVNKLDSIIDQVNISKNYIIVESQQPQNLKEFSRKGYKTSYYLPGNLHRLAIDSLENTVVSIKDNLESEYLNFISFPIEDYETVKKYFSNENLLIWELSRPKGFQNKLRLYRALNDVKVNGVLMPFKSKADR